MSSVEIKNILGGRNTENYLGILFGMVFRDCSWWCSDRDHRVTGIKPGIPACQESVAAFCTICLALKQERIQCISVQVRSSESFFFLFLPQACSQENISLWSQTGQWSHRLPGAELYLKDVQCGCHICRRNCDPASFLLELTLSYNLTLICATPTMLYLEYKL